MASTDAMGQAVGCDGGTTRAQPCSIVHLRFAGVLSFLAASLVPAAGIAGQTGAGNAPAAQVATPGVDPEAGPDRSAPVLIGGEPVIWVTAGAGPYSPEYRADRISQRATDIVHDRSLPSLAVTVTDTERSSELRVGPRLLMVVTARDADSVGVARSALAAQYARDLEAALGAEKLRYAPATLVRSGLAGLAATAVLAVFLAILARVTGWIRGRIRRWQADQSVAVRVQQVVLVSAAEISRISERFVVAFRFLIILLAFDLYLTFVLGLFPWTRAVSLTLLNYLITPIQTAAVAFVGYLPKLLFVIVICGFVYLAIRLVGLFFQQIRQGRIVFASFPVEWADPTNKIIRVLLIAFGVIVAFPY